MTALVTFSQDFQYLHLVTTDRFAFSLTVRLVTSAIIVHRSGLCQVSSGSNIHSNPAPDHRGLEQPLALLDAIESLQSLFQGRRGAENAPIT
jgi:hypothetical protein